jgi:hypothetical protein
MYPCQYPGCNARYDETIAGTSGSLYPGDTENTEAGMFTGWIYPHDAEMQGDDITPTHDHIINVLVKVEVYDEK